jgi:hypothetical protein
MMVYEFVVDVVAVAGNFVLLNEWMQTAKVCDADEAE